MNRNKFIRGGSRPTHNFCPDCGERITWVSKDVCPCKLKLGWVVHESVTPNNAFQNFVLQDPPENNRGPREPFEITSNPRVRWSEANFQRYNVMDRTRERQRYESLGPSASILNTDSPT